ncbi:hypothetical protein B0H11DRAFT_2230765 [Mycena galericulata]|nr:hypothetical protein B0H11DRAFT_2230765 [Mycena galericulata]
MLMKSHDRDTRMGKSVESQRNSSLQVLAIDEQLRRGMKMRRMRKKSRAVPSRASVAEFRVASAINHGIAPFTPAPMSFLSAALSSLVLIGLDFKKDLDLFLPPFVPLSTFEPRPKLVRATGEPTARRLRGSLRFIISLRVPGCALETLYALIVPIFSMSNPCQESYLLLADS